MGCSGIGRTLNRRNDAEAVATLVASLERGVNFYDTAPGYSAGESERLIGKAFEGKRDKIIIASKAGVRGTGIAHVAKRYKHLLRPLRSLLSPGGRLPRFLETRRHVDFSTDFLVASVDASLKRLRTDYLDILLLHHPTTEALRSAAFSDTFIELKRVGKIRHWGVSADSLEQAMLSLEIPGIEVIQVAMSMLSQEPMFTFFDHVRRRDVGIVARKILEQGVLTGRRTGTKADWWVADRERLMSLKMRVEQLGFLETDARTLTQSALLFMRGLDHVATSVVGYSSLDHLQEVAAAYDLPPLTDGELSRLRAVR